MIIANVTDAISSNLQMLLVIGGPFLVFTIVIHLLERVIQRRLAERFGWNSVLWTGWLGTPIHELSHVAMCILFRHRVDEVSLFEPDPASGRLGFVRHSWRKGNWFEEFGNVFIGLAPLAGGSIALIALLWLFYPDAVSAAMAIDVESQSSIDRVLASVSETFSSILQPANFLNFKFWVFIYLVLCVGSHMAPSRSDYQGMGSGIFISGISVIAILLLITVFVADTNDFQVSVVNLLSPLFALFAITAVLCSIATAIVSLVVGYFPKRFNVR